MGVCEDKVCSAIVCDKGGECETLKPSVCGDTMGITIVACKNNTIVPSPRCLTLELYAPKCN